MIYNSSELISREAAEIVRAGQVSAQKFWQLHWEKVAGELRNGTALVQHFLARCLESAGNDTWR